MVVQLRRMAFLNKIYSPRGVNFCPLSLKVVSGPLFISFRGFTYIELQVYKLLPKSECRFYLGGMTLNREYRYAEDRYTGVLPHTFYYNFCQANE